jgi:hypothetical protein
MKSNRNFILAVIIFFLVCAPLWAENRVYFNPPLQGEKDVASYIFEAIGAGQKQILIQQYQFDEPITSNPELVPNKPY